MMLAFLLSPIGRWLAAFAVIAALTGIIVMKIRHDAQSALLAQIEREKTDAITKARDARDRLRAVCERNPADCLPDDWFRDE